MNDARHRTSDARTASHGPVAAGDGRAGEPWPSPARAWYGLGILTLVLLIATIDRNILSLLIEPIKHDLHISDTRASFLIGGAFVLFYMLLGLPISRLADVHSRRLIIGIGIACWSVMTCLCGFAQSYWQLFFARAGVGAGESALAPATYSIMTDSFPREKLPRAMAIISMGFTGGIAIASLAGGAVVQMISGIHELVLPVIGSVRPWQMVFFVVGLPGFVIALMMASVDEPRRRGLISRHTTATAGPVRALPVMDVVRFFAAERATFVPMFVAMGIKTLLAFGSGLWLPSFFVRTYHWTIPQIAYAQGVIVLFTSIAGLLGGGWLAEILARRGFDDANIRVLLIATILVLPTSVLFPLMPTPTLALVLFGANYFFAAIGIAPANAALQIVTPNEMRGQIRAAYQFVFNVIGYFLGPLFVALFTDYVFKSDLAIRYSLTASAAIVGPIAIVITWWGLKPYARSVVRASAWK
jgi:MFS family permease